MADNITGPLSLLAGILSLPKAWNDERSRAILNNQLLQNLSKEGQQVPQLPVPSEFPGTHVPVLGSILSGVGTAGQILGTALGNAPRPPTFDTPLLAMMMSNQRFNIGQENTADYRKSLMDFRGQTEADRKQEAADRLKESQRHDEEIEKLRQEGLQTGPKNEIELFQKDPKAFGDFERAKAAAAGERAEAIQQTKPVGVPKTMVGAYLQEGQQMGLTGPDLTNYVVGRQASAQKTFAEAKTAALTSATRTMTEAAPGVIDLANKVEDSLGKIETGPFASRWQEFSAGKIGAPNPDFTTYRTNVDLLQTLLLRMHVGARGGQQLLGQFKEMLSYGTQSPENMRAALEAIKSYAGDLQERGKAAGVGGQAPIPNPTSGNVPPAPTGGGGSGSLDDLLKQYGH